MSNTQLTIITGIAGSDLEKTKKDCELAKITFPSYTKNVTAPVAQLNKQIYSKLGMSWSSVESIPLEASWMKNFVEKALKTLSLLNKDEPLGICDPLLARTLPIWCSAAMLIGLSDVALVYVYDHPKNCVANLEKVHGLDSHSGYKLWVNQIFDLSQIVRSAKEGSINLQKIAFIDNTDIHMSAPHTEISPDNLSYLLYNQMRSVL